MTWVLGKLWSSVEQERKTKNEFRCKLIILMKTKRIIVFKMNTEEHMRSVYQQWTLFGFKPFWMILISISVFMIQPIMNNYRCFERFAQINRSLITRKKSTFRQNVGTKCFLWSRRKCSGNLHTRIYMRLKKNQNHSTTKTMENPNNFSFTPPVKPKTAKTFDQIKWKKN